MVEGRKESVESRCMTSSKTCKGRILIKTQPLFMFHLLLLLFLLLLSIIPSLPFSPLSISLLETPTFLLNVPQLSAHI